MKDSKKLIGLELDNLTAFTAEIIAVKHRLYCYTLQLDGWVDGWIVVSFLTVVNFLSGGEKTPYEIKGELLAVCRTFREFQLEVHDNKKASGFGGNPDGSLRSLVPDGRQRSYGTHRRCQASHHLPSIG